MSYITKTNPDEMTFGTSLQGYITATYAELVELFGKPHDFFDDYKTDAEWYVEFDDGTVATIYNWKNGRNYCGPDAPAVENITSWNVGGLTEAALDKVLEVSTEYRLNVEFNSLSYAKRRMLLDHEKRHGEALHNRIWSNDPVDRVINDDLRD